MRVSVGAECVVLRSLPFPAAAGYILNGCNAGVLLLQGGKASKRFRAILPGVLLAQLVECANVCKVFHGVVVLLVFVLVWRHSAFTRACDRPTFVGLHYRRDGGLSCSIFCIRRIRPND